MSGVRLAVTGGRAFTDAYELDWHLRGLLVDRGISVLMEPGTPGAPALARQWGRAMGIPTVTYYRGPWQRAAKREQDTLKAKRMIERGRPDVLVAFKGGRSTAAFIALAEAA